MRELTATVLENKKIAAGIYSMTFVTEEEIPVIPGQFCMIGVNGFPLRRPIAVCKAEGERITVCYKLKGEGTRRLSGTLKGDKIPVLLPLGNGFTLRENEKKIALVGGGVGIFPLICAIRAYADRRDLYAFMGFRDKASVCLEYEMRRGKELVIATDDGSVGYRGTAVKAFMENVERVKPDAVLACGPAPMLRALKNASAGRGFPVYVSLEERMGCGIGACLVCTCEKTDGSRARVCKDGPVFEISDIRL